MAGTALADLWAPPEFQDEDSIRAAFMLGSQRTPYQDAEFAFLQLVELAVRALSPGINDPFTAVMCIDRIAAALCLLADRSLPESFRLDGQGVLRVVGQPYEYGTLVESAFSQIRESGKTNPVIVERLRRQISMVLTRARQPEFRSALEQEQKLLPLI